MLEWIAIVIQGGAVGIAVLLILYMWAKDRMYNKTLNNHLVHLDTTLGRLDATMKNISSNHESIKNTIETNTRVAQESVRTMERMKGFLNGKR